MAISTTDVKKLWGLAAGQCSRPGCEVSCIRILTDEPTLIGEMAHVIARRPSGPRGDTVGGDDTYRNLILLCPTHHREVDKAPEGTFPAETLLAWKEQHEENVRASLISPRFTNQYELGVYIQRLLTKNRLVWNTYGPESAAATDNPLSNAADIWALRKLDTLLPNNRKIIEAINRNVELFDADGYEAACAFIEHAEGFEISCYNRAEGVPRFPAHFEELVRAYVGIQ